MERLFRASRFWRRFGDCTRIPIPERSIILWCGCGDISKTIRGIQSICRRCVGSGTGSWPNRGSRTNAIGLTLPFNGGEPLRPAQLCQQRFPALDRDVVEAAEHHDVDRNRDGSEYQEEDRRKPEVLIEAGECE